MQELSTNKKLKIIKLYLTGFSYDEIAQKTGVSKGTVANIISDLKAGLFPEVSTVPEEIEQLRDLAISLRRGGVSPVQANIGLSVLERLADIGIEPADMEKCHTLLQALSSTDLDLQAMAKSILVIEEAKQNTGLTLEELEAKVVSLREEAEKLVPISKEIEARKKELEQLEKNRNSLIGKIKELNNREVSLSSSVDTLEVKEVQLRNHVVELEERARNADKQLLDARRELKTLDKTGMNLENLGKFTTKLREVSAHHDIKPEDLCYYLLKELRMLDKGLKLESAIKERETQLGSARNEIVKKQAEKEELLALNNQLKLNRSKLEAEIAQSRKQLVQDINTLSGTSKEAIQDIKDSFKLGINNSITEVNKLANEALRIGKEIGDLESKIESLNWVNPLLLLVQGANGLDDQQVKVIGLKVLRSMSSWFKDSHSDDWNLSLLRSSIENSVSELEKWKPSTT